MAEFTIRNKKTNPIYTLNESVLQALLAARPDASSLVMAKHTRAYKALVGKPINLTHEQTMLFLQRYGADERGTWTSEFNNMPPALFYVERAFKDGFLEGGTSFKGFLEELKVAAQFYDMLDTYLKATHV